MAEYLNGFAALEPYFVNGLSDPQIYDPHVVTPRGEHERPGNSPGRAVAVEIEPMRHAGKTKALGCDQGFPGIGDRPMFGLSRTPRPARTSSRRARPGTRAPQLPARLLRALPPPLLRLHPM